LSSILKALKKLENQAKEQVPVRFRQQKNQVQNSRRQRVSDHLRANKRYLIILAGLVFAVAGGITLNQSVRDNHPKVAAKKETRRQSPARLPEKKAALSNTVEKKLPPRIKVSEPVEKEAQMPPAPVYKSGDSPSEAFNKETPMPEQAKKETIVGKGDEKHEQYVKPEPFATAPVKQSSETGIEIQAIAWAGDPINRLAVINGLILREGESVDNIMVMHIGKDAVVFEKGGAEWKQLFGF
jgi:hypothetical protein